MAAGPGRQPGRRAHGPRLGRQHFQGNGQVDLTEVLPGPASENTTMSENRDGHALSSLWNDLAVCA